MGAFELGRVRAHVNGRIRAHTRLSSYCTRPRSSASIAPHTPGANELERVLCGRMQAQARTSSIVRAHVHGRVQARTRKRSDVYDGIIRSRARTISRQRAFQLVRARARLRSSSGALKLLGRVRSRAVELMSTGACKIARKRAQTCTMGAFELGRTRAHVSWRVRARTRPSSGVPIVSCTLGA